ncbi:hypothetical protein ACFOWE_31300 [Planomonospora corallina]|uniref:Uncharacterized protein n=1 Tax=Planomonospora corallina TaxID=1806052 RepID=A0ABV8II74_9ACTN
MSLLLLVGISVVLFLALIGAAAVAVAGWFVAPIVRDSWRAHRRIARDRAVRRRRDQMRLAAGRTRGRRP